MYLGNKSLFSTTQNCKQMKKIVGSISRGQGHEILNQLEAAMKAVGVDPEQTSKNLLSRNGFKKLMMDHLKANGNAIVSEKFEPTDFIVSTTPSNETYTIGKDLKKLIATKEDGGVFDWIDGDITDWFGDVSFTDTESVSGKVQLFKNSITHHNIIGEGENLDIYQEYELGHALLLVTQLVKAGAIEKKGYGVIIYLKNQRNGNRYGLNVYRLGDGKLRVYIYRVNLVNEWHAGRGVLFSN